jgi:hypothetical protein
MGSVNWNTQAFSVVGV